MIYRKEEQGDAKRIPREKRDVLKECFEARGFAASALKELESALSALPRVDTETGSSDCPFAESLYAKKFKAERKVQLGVERLRGLRAALDGEISRCRSNADRIARDSERLHRPEPVAAYDSARSAQAGEIERLLHERRRILDMIERAEQALARSFKKAWPLGEPKEESFFPPADVPAGGLAVQPSSPGSMGRTDAIATEVSDLIGMGRL